MQPCIAVRFHRGGKLFISHGGSLWVGKLAVLLQLNHSRHSRQLASCVKDLPCWVEGRCPFPCLRGFCKIERNRVRYEQNRVQYEQNRVVYKIEGIPGVFLNKIGLFVESALFGRRHCRCFEESNTEKTVWGAACTQGVVGSGARTRLEAFCRRA